MWFDNLWNAKAPIPNTCGDNINCNRVIICSALLLFFTLTSCAKKPLEFSNFDKINKCDINKIGSILNYFSYNNISEKKNLNKVIDYRAFQEPCIGKATVYSPLITNEVRLLDGSLFEELIIQYSISKESGICLIKSRKPGHGGPKVSFCDK